MVLWSLAVWEACHRFDIMPLVDRLHELTGGDLEAFATDEAGARRGLSQVHQFLLTAQLEEEWALAREDGSFVRSPGASELDHGLSLEAWKEFEWNSSRTSRSSKMHDEVRTIAKPDVKPMIRRLTGWTCGPGGPLARG